MKDKLLADAFAQCLDDMENKGASLEECLARYPDLRYELDPALRMVLDMRALPPWHVSPEFKATARQRIVRRIRQRQAEQSLGEKLAALNPLNWLGRLSLAPVAVRVIAVVLAGLLIVSGGTAIASNDTLPDNPLHQVKLATESLELLLRGGDSRTTLLVEILDRRASELLTMAWQDKLDGAQRALVNYEAALQVGHNMLGQYNPGLASDTAFAVQWQEALARNLAVIQGLVDAMPERQQAGLRVVINATQKELAWVNDLLVKTPQEPDEIVSPTRGIGETPTPGHCQYTVKKGDTLSSIAQRHNTTWQRLAALNNLTSPDAIRAGQQLTVPCGTTSGNIQTTPPAEFKLCPYIVKSGDTLSSIAQKYNTTTRLLIAVNNLPSADRILAGQRLSVPCYAR